MPAGFQVDLGALHTRPPPVGGVGEDVGKHHAAIVPDRPFGPAETLGERLQRGVGRHQTVEGRIEALDLPLERMRFVVGGGDDEWQEQCEEAERFHPEEEGVAEQLNVTAEQVEAELARGEGGNSEPGASGIVRQKTAAEGAACWL